MIVVSVHIRAKQGSRDTVIQMSQEMIAPSQAEKGCISYNFFADTLDPGRFLFFEEWESAEALKLHGETPHFIRYSAALPAHVEDRSVRVYDVSSTKRL